MGALLNTVIKTEYIYNGEFLAYMAHEILKA